MTSNYITENRAFIQAIRQVCREQDIQYAAFSNDWILRLQRGDITRFIFAYELDCNNQASSAIANDKVATFLLLKDVSVLSVPHYLLKSAVMPEIDGQLLNDLVHEHKSVVVKPLHGSRGTQVGRFNSVVEAHEFIQEAANIDEWCCAPYIGIERELRIVVFDGSVQLAYEKLDPQLINNVNMFNLNLGAHAKKIPISELSSAIKQLAIASMQAIGLKLGAVDVIIDSHGKAKVLEINSGFSLEHYAAMNEENRLQVINFYEQVISSMFTEIV